MQKNNPITNTFFIITKDNYIESILLVLAIGCRFLSGFTADLSFLILAIYSLIGPSQLIKAMVLCWFFSMLNPGLSPIAENAAVGRYLVFFASTFGLFLRGGFKTFSQFSLMTLLIGVFLIIHSIAFSYIPSVSILKAFIWTLTICTLLNAWNLLNNYQRLYIKDWVISFLILILFLSAPFYFINSIGFLRNGSGFQGILNHPQAFGPVMAIVAGLVFADICSKSKISKSKVVIFFLSIIFTILSGTRTAGLAFLISIFGALISIRLFSGIQIKYFTPGLGSKRLMFLIIIMISGFISIAASGLMNKYINKYDGDSNRSIAEVYEESRAPLYLPMINNIINHPYFGIGFGIASDPSKMHVNRDPVFGLPIGASIEKGIAPLAVIEEVGFIGFVLVLIWIFMILKRAAINGLQTFIIALTLIFINFGESVLFSPGGLGLIFLILISLVSNQPKIVSANHENQKI